MAPRPRLLKPVRAFGMAICAAAVLLSATASVARAQALPLDTSQFSDLAKLTDPAFVNEAVRTVGALADHRPYDPASISVDRSGLELGIEASLVKVPESFSAQLASVGAIDASSSPAALPIPRIHLRTYLGSRLGAGVSAIRYRGYRIIGADLKIVIKEAAEETYSAALRLCYADARLGFVSSQTWSPQLVFSKPLAFAEPYLGLGAQIISGQVSITRSIAGQSVSFSSDGKATQFFSFMGLSLHPVTGLQLAFEGSYNTGGTPTLGVRLGLGF